MVVLRTRSILCLLLVVFVWPGIACAGNPGTSSAPGTNARDIAQTRLAESVTELRARMNACMERKDVLSADEFSGIELGDDALRAALSYFSVKADNACIEQQARDYVVAAYVAERAGVVPGEGEDSPEEADLGALVLDSWWRELQLEAQYRQLPANSRARLGRIPALQRPFDLLKSARALGLYQ